MDDGALSPSPYVAADPGRRFRHHPLDLATDHVLVGRADAALVAAAPVREAADRIAQQLSALAAVASAGSGGFMAVHMRVEDDWAEYCARQEGLFGQLPGARGGGAAKFCVPAREIVQRVDAHAAAHGFGAVYVAVSRAHAAAGRHTEGSPLPSGAQNPLDVWHREAGNGGGARHAYSAADFEAEGGASGDWPYALQSALDAEVCKRAAIFIGTSWSFFSNHVAKVRARVARPSYIYNLPDEGGAVMVLRTDGGELFEPHDATRVPSALLTDDDEENPTQALRHSQ